MVEQTARLGMLLTDFIEQYHRQPFELTNGQVITLSPNVAGHQWVAQHIYHSLRAYAQPNQLGFVAIETPFVVQENTESGTWVKGSRTPDWKTKPYVLVPDLAIEVVSPYDRYSEIDDKVEHYLADGVHLVWVVDPQRHKVSVHRSDSDQPTILRENGTLDGDELLPGFSLALKALFE